MQRLLSETEWTIQGSASVIAFEKAGGGDWKEWDRFITIDGKKAYHIGNICGTCEFFFERLDGANKSISPREVSNALSQGITDISEEFLRKVSKILPNGRYIVSLLRINPSVVTIGSDNDYFKNEQVKVWGIDGFWGFPHHPKIQYYRGLSTEVAERRKLFEFFIPMFPHGWLHKEKVIEYRNKINEKLQPTALAVSVLDVKEPAYLEDENNMESHYCLAHYIIDGHHKLYAAAEQCKPLTLLSFLAIDEGISTTDDIKKVLAIEE